VVGHEGRGGISSKKARKLKPSGRLGKRRGRGGKDLLKGRATSSERKMERCQGLVA